MPERDADELVLVASHVRVHGVRGEISARPLAGDPGRFFPGLSLVWRRPGHEDRILTVRSVRGGADKVLLGCVEIADCTAAQTYNGGELWAAAATSPELEEGVYYHHQLLGMTVTDASGAELGRLTAVFTTGAHDNYEVTRADGVSFLVPAVPEFVTQVDVAGRRMVIEPIPGLIPEPGPPGKRSGK